jgi:hypothetical protein
VVSDLRSPLTESNRRPSPYHGPRGGFLTCGDRGRNVSDLQFSGLGESGCALAGGAIVTTIVPTFRVLSPSWPPGADAVRTGSPSSNGVRAAGSARATRASSLPLAARREMLIGRLPWRRPTGPLLVRGFRVSTPALHSRSWCALWRGRADEQIARDEPHSDWPMQSTAPVVTDGRG